MRNGFLGSLLVLLAGAGVAAAQSYYPPYRASAFPGWQNPPQAGYYNPYSVPGQQAYPTWPSPQTMGASYAVPYQGQPPLAGYGPPMPNYAAYPGGQALPRWPTPNPYAPPQMGGPLPVSPPATAAATPTPPSSPPPPNQPLVKMGEGLDLTPHPPVVALPKPGTQLFQDDPVGCGPSCLAAPPLPPPSHEKNPPFIGPCGYRFYGNAQALSWWIKQQEAPPLLSAGPLFTPDNALNNQTGFNTQQHWGARATFGGWLDPQQRLGLEVTGLYLVQRTPTLSMASPAIGTFGNPIVNPATQVASFVPVASAGLLAGTAQVQTPSQLWGGELNLRKELCRTACLHLDLIGGFRYLDLREGLDLTEVSQFTPAVAALKGSSLSSSDRFHTNNQFYGGQIGAELELHQGRFFIDLWGKVAVGSMNENVTINGTTLLTSNAGLQLARLGGVYAQPSNIGSYNRNEVSAIPEVGVNVGCQLTAHLRASVGYSFLYIAEVVRPGDQIDRTVNLTQQNAGGLVGTARPLFAFNASDFWAQGISLGLEFRY